MKFEHLLKAVAPAAGELYDLALYQDGRIQTAGFLPSNRCSNSSSVAKAFVVTAIGLLWDEGKLDPSMTVKEALGSAWMDDAAPGWEKATLHHAMKHRLGFDEGFLDIDVDDASQYPSDDYLSMVLRHPLAYAPGEHYQYTDAAFYLLSRVVSAAAGENLDRYLYPRLLKPLGFKEAAWSCCPQGYPMGATGLYISSEDAVKLAALYLEGGLWQGRRILSEAWVRRVLSEGYELNPTGAGDLIGKGGMWGQGIAFSPAGGFAVAWHGHGRGEALQNMASLIAGGR